MVITKTNLKMKKSDSESLAYINLLKRISLNKYSAN